MQYIEKDLGSFNLHMIKTKKYKTVTMKIVFHSEIVKEEITKRNVLQDILLQSTKTYSTKRDMIIQAEELYAADIYNSTQRWGRYIMTSFILQVLNDKYTEEGNLKKAIEFMHEIIFNPDVNDSKFKKDKLSLVKNNCEVALSSIKEDSGQYAKIRLQEAYDKEGPISYRMHGYLEDLDKITPENLYRYYEKMIDKDFVDIFIIGDIDTDEILSLIKENFKFRKIKKHRVPYVLDVVKPRKRRLLARETTKNTQSKLVMACPIGKLSEYEKNYPLVLANIILGGGSESKLFREVRENNSLCYTIYSSLSKLDNLILISAGIDKEDYNKTVEVTTKLLDNLKKGKFTEKDINIAKEMYNASINTIEESPAHMINEYLTEMVIGFENYKERSEIMNKVTKKEIVKAFKNINIDTIFLLEGDCK